MSVNEKMTTIADNIRGYGGITGKLNLDDMANRIGTVYLNGYDEGNAQGKEEGRMQGYSLGFDEGKTAERSEFWEEYYTTASWAYAFYGAFWSDKNYNPHKTINPAAGTSASAMYQACGITDTKVPLDLSGVSSISYIFYGCKYLKTIRDIIFPPSGNTTNAFAGCSALENITVSGSIQISLVFTSCKLLNKASIESIINALSATTSGLTVTFSKEAVNNAFGIDIDDESTYPEGSEYYNLRYSKSNWTFSYA